MMSKEKGSKIHTAVTESPLDIMAAHAFVSDPAHGAVNSFVGIVRDHNDGQATEGIFYDCHKELAEETLQRLCAETLDLAKGQAKIWLEHRTGHLGIGEASVFIAVSTPHRAESFDLCRALIERLKKEAPVWKQEHYTDGSAAWLKGAPLKATVRE